MKATLQKLSVFILLTAIIASCSVQKRRYNKGWHIDWASAHTKTNSKKPVEGAQHPAIKACQAIAQQNTAVAVSAPEKEKPSVPVITAEADSYRPKDAVTKPAEATHAVEVAQPASVKKPASLSSRHFKTVTLVQKMQGNDDASTDTLGLLSFIFALVGLVTGIGFLLALILGSMALSRYRAGSGTPDKKIFATLGFIIGLIGLIVFLLVLLIILALVA